MIPEAKEYFGKYKIRDLELGSLSLLEFGGTKRTILLGQGCPKPSMVGQKAEISTQRKICEEIEAHQDPES